MKILAIETSCDETAAAVIEKTDDVPVRILSTTLATSSDLHAQTGGIIPERAAREQLQYCVPVITKALLASEDIPFTDLATAIKKSNELISSSIDAIAVTQGPGLIGSLLVGIETAKTLAMSMSKPIIPVNHLLAHLYANFIDREVHFPFIGLIVSGGHTDILLFTDHGKYTWLGGTRDDAAGEALDKIGRLLHLPYPAGPEIEKRAKNAKNKDISFSRPLLHSDDFDFSFSGLKTEVSRFIQKKGALSDSDIAEISYGVQKSVIDVLVKKTIKAALQHNCNTIVLGGGVSANQTLRDTFTEVLAQEIPDAKLYFPEKIHTTDNAAMIGAYAAYNFAPIPWQKIKASPELYFQ